MFPRLDTSTTWQGQAQGSTQEQYTEMQLFFLLRLKQMLERKRRCLTGTPVIEWQLQLCNRALHSTYCDCIDHGVREEACLLFQQFGKKPTAEVRG